MLARKYPNGFKNQNWLGFFIELIIVIVGITIAFYLQKASVKKEEERVQEIRTANLKREIELNLEYLDGIDSSRNVLDGAFSGFIEYLDKRIAEGEDDLSLDTLSYYWALCFSTSSFEIQHNQLSHYLSDPGSFKDTELESELVKLENIIINTDHLEKFYVERKINRVIDPVMGSVDFVRMNVLKAEMFNSRAYFNDLVIMADIERQRTVYFKKLVGQLERVNQLLQ